MTNKTYSAVSTIIGYMIGAGILGLPFVFARSGYLTGLISLIALGTCVMFLNLYLGEVCLRTREQHQLTGYAEKYIGRWGKYLMTAAMIFGVYGALVAYFIKQGQFLSALLSQFIGGTPLMYSIIFFIFGSYILYRGIDAMEKGEIFMVSSIFMIIAVLLITAAPSIDTANLGLFSWGNMLIPFGVILFAFNAVGAVPEAAIELKKDRKLLKKSIIYAMLAGIGIYALFTALVVGVTGASTSDGAILGLASVLGDYITIIGVLFGLLVIASSFLAVGISLKEMYMFDFRMKPKMATFLTCIVPFLIGLGIVYFDIHNAFYKVIDITGSIEVPIVAFLIILMFWSAKKHGDRKPEYSINSLGIIGFVIGLIFLLALINGIIGFF